jgi:SET domain-containing protein
MNEKDVVEVGPSRIGLGVFSRREFACEEVISEIDGETIAEDGYESDYCMDLGNGSVLEPNEPFRFLNHSCEPNAELVIWEDASSDPSQIWLHARTHIRPGDEITIDYGWEGSGKIQCHCGSPSCRGWLMAAESCLEAQV